MEGNAGTLCHAAKNPDKIRKNDWPEVAAQEVIRAVQNAGHKPEKIG